MRRMTQVLVAVAGCILLFAALAVGPVLAQPLDPAAAPAALEPPPATAVPGASAPFDPEAATRAYLDRLSSEEKARSDSYFEGGYWLQLWGFLYGLGVAWLLLGTGLSVRMRNLAEKTLGVKFIQPAIYAVQYILLTTLLGFPFTLYVSYFREHQYGLANQSFGPWMRDQVTGLIIGLIMFSIALMFLYWVLRKATRTWWIWGAVVSVIFLALMLVVTPVWINPLFNEYTTLDDPEVRDPILQMAAANGVPVGDVWVSDASRQSKRISANVSGFAGTERITLNDNLLNRTSLPEIKAVMGHEIGHYALNHVYELLIELGLVIALGFAFIAFAFDRVNRRWGGGWGIRDIADPAGLPLIGILLSVFFFVMTPVTNSIIRVNESEADIYGLNASQEPEGFAEVALKLGEYRKLDPGPMEEMIFFDHPSGRERILMAMRWKAAQLAAQAQSGEKSDSISE